MDRLPEIARGDFDAVRDAVHRVTGIALADSKRTLVQSRLAKRLRQLGLPDFGAYVEHLRRDAEGEREALIEALTTHTTHFWREGHHFDEFARLVLSPAAQRRGAGKLRVWCAAASSGEEPYSIAITCAQHLDLKKWDVKILATDIDVGVLEEAAAGVYEAAVADAKPECAEYFVPGSGEKAGLVQVRKDARQLVRFRRLNLVAPNWPVRPVFDAIFVRNILIYFDATTQLEVVDRLAQHLLPGGILVLGHAESMLGVKAGLRSVGRGVFEARPQ
jgi:chemotaxis protein methyltransferase CheR